MSRYLPAISSYSDIRNFIQQSLPLEQAKKTIYYKTDSGPSFSLHYQSSSDVDPGKIALLLATVAKLFRVTFRCQSIGYGTYKVTFSVVANSKEEAERVARFVNNSKRIAELTTSAKRTSTVVQKISEPYSLKGLSSYIRKTAKDASEEREALDLFEAMVEIAEEELALDVASGATIEERAIKLDVEAAQSIPPSESSYWRIADAIGAFLGGVTKSLLGG